MNVEEFKNSLQQQQPPAGLPALVEALWWDAKGDWERAHMLAQGVEGAAGAWVHAFLHRREGDLPNASYWYRRTGKPVSREPLDGERAAILTMLLNA